MAGLGHASERPSFSGDRWNSYCLSSLAAQSIYSSRLHWTPDLATMETAAPTGSFGSTSCCSLLRRLSLGGATPLLPAPVCNPNKAVFIVDAKTTEVWPGPALASQANPSGT